MAVESTMKKLIIAIMVGVLAGCSSMSPVDNRKSYAQPDWYTSCAQKGTEGHFWWAKEYAYACGAGESLFAQAAEEQMYAIALNNLAKRINGEVNSSTEIVFSDERKTARTRILYTVKMTTIRMVACETCIPLAAQFAQFRTHPKREPGPNAQCLRSRRSRQTRRS
jgi:hypothetical protein